MAASAAAPISSKRWRSAPVRCRSAVRRCGGLPVHGADGVAAVMDHLRDELLRAMQLCGVASPQDATPDLVGT